MAREGLNSRLETMPAANEHNFAVMVYEIDGIGFSTVEEFVAEFIRMAVPQCDPAFHNLDAF